MVETPLTLTHVAAYERAHAARGEALRTFLSRLRPWAARR